MSTAMLAGSVVVVTGGAGLIGRSLSEGIIEAGGRCVIADIDAEAAASWAKNLETRYPGCASTYQLDISSDESVRRVISDVFGRYGRLDAVVNNAYPRTASYGRKLEEVTYRDFCDNLSSHLGGYFEVAKQFGIFFKANGGGTIINMASVYGVIAPRFDLYSGSSMTMPVEYAAIKAGVIHLTRYFAQYFKHDGVRVNSISPGGVFDRQPEGFVARYVESCKGKTMLEASDVVGTLVFLLSGMSLHITGQNVIVDDGFSL